MTRSQIEYILALGKLKNFRLAAEACFITQSTLSAMIAKFEDQIGVEIFNRKTRPLSITSQGETIIKSLQSISREFQLFDETIYDLNDIEIGELNLACIPTVAPYLYPRILNQISNKYGKVNFSIHELTTENIVSEIIAGNIDIGIVSIPLDNKELVEYPLYEEDFLIYDYGRNLSSKNYSVTDIDIDRLWLLEEGHCMRNQVGKICELRQQKKINGNLVYSCGSIFTLIEMVKMNKGVTLLPRLAMINNRQIDEKRVFNISQPVPTRIVGLVTHKNYVKKQLLTTLTEIIKDAINPILKTRKKRKESVDPF